MSELTRCNYCELRLIRERAERNGQIVTLRGHYVHVHYPDESLDTREWDDGNTQIKAWFMALSEECVC